MLNRMGASVRFTEKRSVAGEDTATIVVMPRSLAEFGSARTTCRR